MKKLASFLIICIVISIHSPLTSFAGISYTIKLGQSTSLYNGAHYDDGTKTWTSSNSSVVQITAPYGNTCGIYAAGLGTCIVTLVTRYSTFETKWIPNSWGGGYWGTVPVTRSESYTYSITVVVESSNSSDVTIVRIGLDDSTIYIGDSIRPYTEMRQSNNHLFYDLSKLSWLSSDESIATVDKYGVIHAIGEGTVTITAQTADGIKDNSVITVSDFTGLTPISTKAELNAVRNNLSDRYYLRNDIVFTAADFEIGGAFYNNSKGWIPIPEFTGYFNGNHYSIQNLTIFSGTDSGLFTKLKDSTVCNLEMVNARISGTHYAGAIAGSTAWASIINCKTTNCTINGSIAGGLAGYSGSSKFDLCLNSSSVTGTYLSGGISGELSFSDLYFCANTGIVTGTNVYGIGGITGMGRISHVLFCSNSGSVNLNCQNNSGGLNGDHYAGGIAGDVGSSRLFNNYNTAKITINSTNSIARSYIAGGITGSLNLDSLMTDCYNSGDIGVSSNTGSAIIGGVSGCILIGSIDSADDGLRILHCYNAGKISVINSLKLYAGAVIGNAAGTSSASSRVLIKECYYLNNNPGLFAAANLYIGTIKNVFSLTSSQMALASSLSNFDFSCNWTINNTAIYKYPTLQGAASPVSYFTCKAAFITRGGSTITPQTVKYNALLKSPAAPTLSGNAFGGWYKDTLCTIPWNFSTEKVTADVILYAKWTPLPATPILTSGISLSYNSVKISWSAVSGASGYEIWRYNLTISNYAKIKTVTVSNYTDTGLITGTVYYYKVRAYTVKSPATIYGNLSAYKAVKPIPAVPAIAAASRLSSTSIKISWLAVAGASGYEICFSTAPAGTYATIASTSALYYSHTGRKTGTTYYYKVRAYRLVSGIRIYSGYSAYRSCKT
ncbi:MAG: InlB B-repeat-containing protein [Saccharofermentanales bacterium]